MSTFLQRLARHRPTWATVAGVTGWGVAVAFFLAWAFNFGGGPFDADRFGTAGEWVSGVGTVAALAFTMYLTLHERHQRRIEREKERTWRDFEQKYKSVIEGSGRADDMRELVPVKVGLRRLDDNTNRDDEALYEAWVHIFNGCNRPLAKVECKLRTSADLNGDVNDPSRPRAVWAGLCEDEVIPPGEWLRRDGMRYHLPIERVDNGLYFTATWTVGEWVYEWSRFPLSDKTYMHASNPTADARRRASEVKETEQERQ